MYFFRSKTQSKHTMNLTFWHTQVDFESIIPWLSTADRETSQQECRNLSKIAASGQLELSSHVCFISRSNRIKHQSCLSHGGDKWGQAESSCQSNTQIKTIASSCPSRKKPASHQSLVHNAVLNWIHYIARLRRQNFYLQTLSIKMWLFDLGACNKASKQPRLQPRSTNRQSLIVASHRWASWAHPPSPHRGGGQPEEENGRNMRCGSCGIWF